MSFPQQIAVWLRRTFPEEPAMQISHETIYRALYVQARGALKRALVAHLRHGQRHRRPRAAAHAVRDARSWTRSAECASDGETVSGGCGPMGAYLPVMDR